MTDPRTWIRLTTTAIALFAAALGACNQPATVQQGLFLPDYGAPCDKETGSPCATPLTCAQTGAGADGAVYTCTFPNCVDAGDCRAGEACLNGTCESMLEVWGVGEPCSGSGTCPAPFLHCEISITGGICVMPGCFYNSQCPGGTICYNGACAAPCE